MFKYRVLNKQNNEFFQEDEVLLKPNGTLYVNGEVFTGKFELQPIIQLPNQPELYVGDAVSYTFEDDGKEPNRLDYILTMDWKYVPKPNTYDELILQFFQDKHHRMFYWAMFKYKGEFIKNKDCYMPNETMAEDIRTIPDSSIAMLRRLGNIGNYKVIYHCTDKEWIAF